MLQECEISSVPLLNFCLLLLLDNTTFKLSFQLRRYKPRVLQVFDLEQKPASTLTFQLSCNGPLYQQMETKGTVLCFNSCFCIYFHCYEIRF